MRKIKFQILWVRNKIDFTKEITTHYTSLDRLTSGEDEFPYDEVEIIAKRQFTGILDCNGVEIYEGDICEVNFHDGVRDLMRVEYLGCTFQLLGNGFWSLTSTNVKTKVIGNIHQHAHLLEK